LSEARQKRGQPKRRGNLIIISAPSGTGKSTVVRRLVASLPGLRFSVSHTTRPRRRGERQGRDYYFVSPRRFLGKVVRNEFLEWARVFDQLYGTSLAGLRAAQKTGQDVLLDIDVQGHEQVRRRGIEAVSIFLMPPSYRELERRLRRRHSDRPEEIARRLEGARSEIRYWRQYDYLVVNDDLASAVEGVRAVVLALRQRRDSQAERAKQILKSFVRKV
jgi:guanylate kinase